ncbi:Thioredoxin reductase [Quillaja saponaria]|uniref:Thioredoxin reductase n=1 Tax=Quillaja saponaria TaxID=32244 RepID=A0AAD7L7W7_QUISA|nr:Thioredoxin reductase [Quillaja saponaria]
MDYHQNLKTKVCIIGSGPAAYTAAIYTARAELNPILLQGNPSKDITDVDNYPGFPYTILRTDLMDRFLNQSLRFGTRVLDEIVTKVDFSITPIKIFTKLKTVEADTVIIATGPDVKRLTVPGSGDAPEGFWNLGIPGYPVCDGASPNLRNKPLAVVGGGDSAMGDANYLTNYASIVYIIHRREKFRASKVLQKRPLGNPKVKVIWNSVVVEAHGDQRLGGIKVKNLVTGEVSDMKVSGLFFAIGHEPATRFLDSQVELDSDGYIVTKSGSTKTSIHGVFAAGDVQDRKYQQAVTAAGTG